jgi:RNA polymerase sigma-70 factor, ECF subfamily
MEADFSIRAGELNEMAVGQLERLSDEELFARMRFGSHDALAILFRRHHPLVLRIAKGILRDAGEAEDVMQIVFLELFQAVEKFDPSRGSSKSWIIRYAYHRSLNRKQYLKARAFYRQEEYGSERGLQPTTPAMAARGLGEAEVKRLVQQSLLMLSQAQRETLQSAFFDGLSMSEIADRQNETVVNVRHHYYRGLQKLRSVLYGEKITKSSRGANGERRSE